jgi:hypothetical protein
MDLFEFFARGKKVAVSKRTEQSSKKIIELSNEQFLKIYTKIPPEITTTFAHRIENYREDAPPCSNCQ